MAGYTHHQQTGEYKMARFRVCMTEISYFMIEAESKEKAEQMILDGEVSIYQGDSDITFETEEVKS